MLTDFTSHVECRVSGMDYGICSYVHYVSPAAQSTGNTSIFNINKI